MTRRVDADLSMGFKSGPDIGEEGGRAASPFFFTSTLSLARAACCLWYKASNRTTKLNSDVNSHECSPQRVTPPPPPPLSNDLSRVPTHQRESCRHETNNL